MKRTLVLAAALAAALPFSALAHKAWLLPSQTVIAGNAPWITVDGAVSNDLFYFNHVPLRLAALSEPLLAQVAKAPEQTLAQLCQWVQAEHGVQVCAATMGKTLKRLGLTRKKRPFTPPSKSKAP